MLIACQSDDTILQDSNNSRFKSNLCAVHVDEFAKASHSYSMRWDEPTTRRVFSAIDVDGDGQVSGDEFMRFINAGMGVGRLDTRANEAPSPLPQRRSTRP